MVPSGEQQFKSLTANIVNIIYLQTLLWPVKDSVICITLFYQDNSKLPHTLEFISSTMRFLFQGDICMLDQRSSSERRESNDRRQRIDRRMRVDSVDIERRAGDNRREDQIRRIHIDRRAAAATFLDIA
jgi:hypothetical protein